MKKFVAYYRVSTEKQGKSGLGLEAQVATVAGVVEAAGGEMIASFTEIESGRKAARPQLKKAIAAAKKAGAILLVAKLDRLSREAKLLFELKESGVEIQAGNISELNTLTLGIYATLAQHEAEQISERTKAALTAKKARGAKLGVKGTENLINGNASEKAGAALTLKAAEDENNIRATTLIECLKAAGTNWTGISNKLNDAGFKTSRGNAFSSKTVAQLWEGHIKRQIAMA